jgi:2-oxoglutarate dehydrogenase E1 component
MHDSTVRGMGPEFGINQGLVEELYAKYLENPRSVDESWQRFFESNGASVAPRPAALERRTQVVASDDYSGPDRRRVGMSGRVYQLITSFRFLGHLYADVDPLGDEPALAKELDYRTYGFQDDDLDRHFPTIDLPGGDESTLRDIIELMSETYCRTIGAEFRMIESSEERRWLQERMESTRNRLTLDRAAQVHLLTKLIDAENLEQFIASSYAPGTKRFSLEGAESLIPLLEMIIERGGQEGMEQLVLGMAHRGRLNVLVNTLETSLRQIFYAFEDRDAERYLGRGDVKYHLGFSSDRVTNAGKRVHITLSFNPSHLEWVNPVVEGRVRAKQERDGDSARKRIVPLLIHGDAAFVGQGVVAETLNLTGLAGYTTGGTIHIIVNNQVGFTTDPEDLRSTRYASDLVRMLNVPVFHVNGEDPEAVAQVATLAVEYRQRFGKDVLIDLYCYRRHGHNEGDEPRFTQPLAYKVIDEKPTIRKIYVSNLVERGQIDESEAERIAKRSRERLEKALEEVRDRGFIPVDESMGGVWTGYLGGWDRDAPEAETAISRERLVELSKKINGLPEDFPAHPKVRTLLEQRHQRVDEDQELDWGAVELLAYASLLDEGTPIRLSGEDVARGTFSHRHVGVWNQQTGERLVPLNQLSSTQGRLECVNSALSEAGVLGFDFGYSLDSPESLVIWEAQFGDFLNAAQVIVDQFITSCEDKWKRLSGIVLYLPHGYEGQGPEHSSARIERFLQNAAEDNVQVCNLTTPAQLFHVLRRQIRRVYRKPLIIFTPKSLLRAAFSAKGPKPVSRLDDLANGRFQRAIPDREVEPDKVRKVLLCSGKVYYDLARRRFEEAIDDIAIVRLEQLYPLNDELDDALAVYADDVPLVWVQEEPWNYGGWFYVNAELPVRLGRTFAVVARERSASPATGSHASHKLEQKLLVDQAFS